MNRALLLVAPLLAAVLGGAGAGGAHAQVPAVAPAPASAVVRTGDTWTDARLEDINDYGTTYRDAFIDELVRYHRAPRDLVQELLTRRGWTPAEVYLACGLAMNAGRPCRGVVDAYVLDPTRGWPAIAKDLGVEPGSPAFHAFKRGLVASYDRWARPLVLDAELAPDFPGRATDATAPLPVKPRTTPIPRKPAARPSS